MKVLKKADFLKLYNDLGINSGDHVMVHSAFSSLGRIEGGPEILVSSLEETLGPEGTLVFPVFNWDILHEGEEIIYDIKNTPSKMGFLSEYFRTRSGTEITRNIFNPLAVKGILTTELLSCANTTTWGSDSPFSILYENNAKVLMLGTDYNTVTFFHVAEAKFNVPYRFVYDFENAFIVDREGKKNPVKNNTLRRYDGYPTDFNIALDLFEENNFVKSQDFGNALVRLLPAREMVDVLVSELNKNPEYLIKKTEARKWIPTRREGFFFAKDFINALWLKNRALISDDYETSLQEINKYIPLEITGIPSGEDVFDWTVPKSWNNKGGEIKTKSGKTLIDLSSHPLRIAIGSSTFKGEVDRNELMSHVKTNKDLPNAIPYCTHYYDNKWSVCLKHEELELLNQDDLFNVTINTDFTHGELKIGEYTIPGKTEETILIPLHLDHPGQCNDNLSGIAVAVDLINQIKNQKMIFNHTIKFIFIPETIGIASFCAKNKDKLNKFKWAIVFDSVGTSNDLMLMNSLRGDTNLDNCAKLALSSVVSDYRTYDFLALKGYGNDERFLQAPGIDIPAISFSRFPYKEYHTSLDNPDIISIAKLKETQRVIVKLLNYIDNDVVPTRKYEGIPQLSKIPNLLSLFIKNPEYKKAMHKLFFLIDGKKSFSSIALETNSSFDFIKDVFDELKRNDKVDF